MLQKNLIYLTIIISTLFSCQERKNDAAITKEFCGELLKAIDAAVTSVELAVKRGGERKVDLEVLNNSKRIAGWKKPYLKNESPENLIQYADSLLGYCKRMKIDDAAIKEIINNKARFNQKKDTMNHYQLLYWTLKAEANLQYVNVGKLGADLIRCYLGCQVPSEISASQIQLGDSIYLTFKLGDDKLSEIKYNLDSLFLENQVTRVKTKLKAVKIGPQYILHTKPKERGKFHIFGSIRTNLPEGFCRNVRIANEFTVN